MIKNKLCSFFVFAFLTIILSIPGGTARAANPSISSFSVSPPSVNSGQPINISWMLADAGGHSLLIPCQQGVVIRKIDGSVFPCDTKTSISSQASDATTISASNISGVLKQITITLIPKDGAGTEYSAAQQSATITIGANQNTIASFTTATSTPTDVSTTLSWTSATDVPGTNMIIGCTTNDITVVGPTIGAQQLPCGSVISSTGLAANGSLGLVFSNKSTTDVTVPVTIIPAIVAGSYDAIHGKSGSIVVLGMEKLETTIASFAALPTQILSGGATILSWGTQNASGVNLKFNCNESISVAKVTGTATTSVACGTFIFDQPLTENSATIAITNMSYSNQTATASLFPANANKTYNGIQQKDVNITVLGMNITALPAPVQTVAPVVAAPVTPVVAVTQATGCVAGYLFNTVTGQACPSTATTPTISSATPTQTSVSSATVKKFVFKKSLSRGITGAEVRALQQFFASYPETYGKVTVNGTFGPATEKLVMKFQEKYGVAKKGNAGYGFVGPATRAKLNTLQ